METTKTELIENIIGQAFPQASIYSNTTFTRDVVKTICNVVWDTAIQDIEKQYAELDHELFDARRLLEIINSQIENLKQENKELIKEIESNKLHLQDTYEEMERTNQAEYERGLQEGYNDHLNDSNNEH
jgi:peptidoglycan hydrolase CwlO-like protein